MGTATVLAVLLHCDEDQKEAQGVGAKEEGHEEELRVEERRAEERQLEIAAPVRHNGACGRSS